MILSIWQIRLFFCILKIIGHSHGDVTWNPPYIRVMLVASIM